jgi:hypothetical protein
MNTAVLAPEVITALIAEGYTEACPSVTSPDQTAITAFYFERVSATYAPRRSTICILQSPTSGGSVSFTSQRFGQIANGSFDSVLTLDGLQNLLNEEVYVGTTVREAMAM